MTTAAKWNYGETIVFNPPARSVNVIFLHCSASDNPDHDDVSVIRDWHVNGNHWDDVGYHFFITRQGDIQEGRDIEQTPAAQKGHNDGSIAICCHGLKKDRFSLQQMDSVRRLCKAIYDGYAQKLRIRGHCEVSPKSCPVYDYKTELRLDANGFMNESAVVVSETVDTPVNETMDSPQQPSSDVQHIHTGSGLKEIAITDQGEQVLALQQLLVNFGLRCDVDGLFGQHTKRCVMQFQAKNGLSKDGIVGAQTIAKMFSSPKIILKTHSRGRDVQVLQLLLSMHGEQLQHDGIFGRGTMDALKRVQHAVRVDADGIFGPKSLKAMISR